MQNVMQSAEEQGTIDDTSASNNEKEMLSEEDIENFLKDERRAAEGVVETSIGEEFETMFREEIQ
jgi:hypothetical protein